jgi:hypothetical protein
LRRIGTAFKMIHRAVITAKMPGSARELTPCGASHDRSLQSTAYRSSPNRDATKFPQRPLVLGDKWDF